MRKKKEKFSSVGETIAFKGADVKNVKKKKTKTKKFLIIQIHVISKLFVFWSRTFVDRALCRPRVETISIFSFFPYMTS